MGKAKKPLLLIVGCLVVLLLLLAAFVLSLPYLIDLEPVKEKVMTALSQQVGGKIEYQSLELTYFPQPRVKVEQVSLSIPDRVEGTVKSLQAYPELLAILRGKLRIARILLESPSIIIRIPKEPEKIEEKTTSTLLDEIEDAISQVSALVSADLPNLNVVVKSGSLQLHKDSRLVVAFDNIDGSVLLPPGPMKIDLSCGANLWERMSLQAALDPKSFRGQGQIDIVDFNAHTLTESLGLTAPVRIEDARMSLQVRFKAEGHRTLRAEMEGAIPSIVFRLDKEAVTIKGKGLKGSVRVDEESVEIFLSELLLDYPRLALSGKLRMDNQRREVMLEVAGRDVDVDSAREAALTLAGTMPVVQTIFDYVRGGRIPLITLTAQVRSCADLAKTENLVIKGRMEQGRAFIRPAGLHLEKVKGDVFISRGVLRGEHLEAGIGNTKGTDGTLMLGLEGKNAPFHLEVMLDADLVQVLPVLNRVVANASFTEEMSLVGNFRGNAKGRLVLGERLNSLSAKVDVSDMALSANYRRVPFPLAITTGQFSYQGDRIGVKNLAGKVGQSAFSGLTAQLSFGKEPYLEILSGKTALLLEEIYPWLSSQDALRNTLESIAAVRGTLNLSDVKSRGLLLRPRDWDFQATGTVNTLAVDTAFVPGPILITNGTFKADPRKLFLSGFDVKILDASLAVSCTLDGYKQGLEQAEFDVGGRITPRDIRWLTDRFHLKRVPDVRAPIVLSATHLSWRKGAHTSFKGDMAVKDGPHISVDMLQGPDQLKVNQLLIRDEVTQAFVSLDLRGRAIGFSFSGSFFEKTLEKIFSGYRSSDGSIKGEFEARIDLDQLERSVVQGRLEARALSPPWRLEKPVQIEDILLEARGNQVLVLPSAFTWGSKRFALSGDVNVSRDKVLLTADLSTDSLDVAEVLEAVKGEGKGKEAGSSPGLPVQGTIRFASQSLTYGGYTWRPFHAEIALVPDLVRVDITQADLCGIATPGKITITPQQLSFDFQPVAKNQDLHTAGLCFLERPIDMTGNFDLQASVRAQGTKDEFAQSLQGDMELTARKGRIYRAKLLSAVFSFLNVTDVLVGKFPDFGKGGLAYDSIHVRGGLDNGKMLIQEAVLQGPSVGIVSRGDIDLIDQSLSFTFLVAPFRTVDYVMGKIPLVGSLLSEPIVSIPVAVSGNLDDPRVKVLSPSAVGSELIGVMGNTLKLPFRLIEPFLPEKKEGLNGPPTTGNTIP